MCECVFSHLIRQESEVNHIIILEIQGNLASYPLEIQGWFDDLPLEKKGKTTPGRDCPSHRRKWRNVKFQKAKWRCAVCEVRCRYQILFNVDFMLCTMCHTKSYLLSPVFDL